MIEIKINNGIAYYAGEVWSSPKNHAFPALGLLFSYQSTFEVIYDGKRITTYGAVIPPNLFHQLMGTEGIIHAIFIEVESKLAQELIQFFNLQNNVIPLQKLKSPIKSSEILDRSFFSQISNVSFEPMSYAKIDLRILRAVEYIKSNLNYNKMGVKEVAAHVYLSESRFAHLFKENISIPFRKYILWYRMRQAINAIINGSNFNQAAYESGFSDAAHFSRTFTCFFGISPSQLLKT